MIRLGTIRAKVPGRPRAPERGFTLIEFLVVIVLLGLMSVVAVRGIRSMTRSDLRSTSGKLAGAIRYLFDRASTTGKVHRLVLDFENGSYWAEESDDRFYLPRDREDEVARQQQLEDIEREQERAAARARGELPPEDEEAEAEEGGDDLGFGFGEDPTGGGANRYSAENYLPKPYKPRRARFRQFREIAIKKIELDDHVRLYSLYTPRLSGPMGEGQGHIYFFPLGFAEAAIVHLTDDKEEHTYSLVVHPLTGRVRIFSEYIAPPVEQVDDEGGAVYEEDER